MKPKVTIVILSVVLILLIGASVILYNSLSEDYVEETVAVTDTTTESDETTKKVLFTKDFLVTDIVGSEVKLSDFFGKPIVVNFWATWCFPCTSEMPHFEEAYKEYGDDIQFLMVNVGDSMAEAKSFIQDQGYTFPLYHDSNYSASFAYNVSSIPCTLFINADGELVHSRIGAMSEEMLLSNIEKIK